MMYQNHGTGRGKSLPQDLITANLRFLVAQLEAGHSEVLTQYLNAMARFHNYSFGNILLIARQRPSSTHVAGIRTWNSLGRFVKKGEPGIMILAPLIRRQRRQEETITAEPNSDRGTCDSEKELIPQLAGFRRAFVWDLAQTDGAALPQLGEIRGEARGCLPRLIHFVIQQGIRFGYSDEIAPARGVSLGGKIVLLPNMSEAEQFTTLVHEVAHELLHKGAQRTAISKTARETEAEAVAFVISQAIGLEIGTASSDYIQLYQGDATLLQQSMEAIQQTSTMILGAISPEEADSAGF